MYNATVPTDGEFTIPFIYGKTYRIQPGTEVSASYVVQVVNGTTINIMGNDTSWLKITVTTSGQNLVIHNNQGRNQDIKVYMV